MVDRCNNKCNLPLFFLSDFSKSHHLFRPEAGTELNGISTDPMSLFWFPFPFPAINQEETNEIKKLLNFFEKKCIFHQIKVPSIKN